MEESYIEDLANRDGPDHGKRRTTGMKKGMKESYVEELASHDVPGHALATREGAAKRWFGVRAGRAIEPRNGVVRGADAVMVRGRSHRWRRFGESSGSPAGSENPSMRVSSSC